MWGGSVGIWKKCWERCGKGRGRGVEKCWVRCGKVCWSVGEVRGDVGVWESVLGCGGGVGKCVGMCGR